MTGGEDSRLRWRCRRGLLELDLILERFLREHDASELRELLELPDPELLDIVMGRSDAFAPHLREVVTRLRAA